MSRSRIARGVAALFALTLLGAACGDDADRRRRAARHRGPGPRRPPPPPTRPRSATPTASSRPSRPGPDEGTLAGMTDDPVATAASSNPVLTTLVGAVGEAGLVDTLNSAPALTVFAPTDCAFAALDPATLEAALADPTGLLTQVLGFHVVAGQQLSVRRPGHPDRGGDLHRRHAAHLRLRGHDHGRRWSGRGGGAGHPHGQRHGPPHRLT